MILFGSPITKDYAWELALFHKQRTYLDGVSFFELKINWDRYFIDHTPRFEFMVVLFNYTIVEFNIYYRHHRT